jgi:DNA-binding response OmpR family regulator
MGARILVVDDSPTIRKVVGSILTRHNYEIMDAEDGIHALQVATLEKPDLMLVDFVMPRMNGYQLCMSLRDKEELKGVPVVLMSAKGDRIRGKFVQQTGALDAITKPFDARGLLAVIESALKKSESASTRKDEPEFEDEALSSRESWGDKTTRNQSLLKLTERLSDILVEQLETSANEVLVPDRAEVKYAFAAALNPEVIAELSHILAEASLAGEGSEMLSGDLASISIAEILQLLEVQKKSGALTLGHAKSRVTLHLREGALDFAHHEGLPPEFLLGRYLVETGALERGVLDKAILASRKSGKVLGDYLVSEDVITQETLREALVQQTSELLYEVVRWRKGRFRFETSQNEHADGARLGLRTAGLVMEGFRRVDEWRLIEDSFDFNDVLFRDDLAIDNLAEHQEIRAEEKAALAAIDGNSTIGEILDRLVGSSFENCKILYRLLNGRLVKRRVG